MRITCDPSVGAADSHLVAEIATGRVRKSYPYDLIKSSAVWACLLLAASCCSAPIDPVGFSQACIAEKLKELEGANAKGCLEYKAGFFNLLAEHGLEAAQAMVPYLQIRRREFPPEDALTVVLYVSLKGTDVRGTEAALAVQELADRSDSASLRSEARQVLVEIARRR